jgi:imidazolonepropionase-like amidohydrolase
VVLAARQGVIVPVHLILLPLLQAALPSPQPVIAVTRVNVIDVARGIARPNQTVIVDGGRIRVAGPSTNVPIPRGARVIDGRSGYLIPGLWDLHVHLQMAGRSALGQYLAAGVTGVRDMGGSFETVRAWRDSITAGVLPGPRIEMTSPIVENRAWRDAVAGMLRKSGDTATAEEIASRSAVSTPDDVAAVVDQALTLGVRFIKLRNDPPPAAYFALLREARRRGLGVVGHPPERTSLAAAVDSGQASLEHGLISFRNGAFHSALDLMTSAERNDFIQRLVRHRTVLVPTLIAGLGYRRTPDSVALAIIADTAGRVDRRRRYVSPELALHWRRQIEMKQLEGPATTDWANLHRQSSAWLRILDSTGVVVLAGTDLGAPLVYPGFSLHDELELQVNDGGRTPARALWGATLGPAEFLGLAGEVGTIETGKAADLVLLEGNPLEDITQVRRIRAVIRNGKVFDRTELEVLLRQGTQD